MTCDWVSYHGSTEKLSLSTVFCNILELPQVLCQETEQQCTQLHLVSRALIIYKGNTLLMQIYIFN